MLLWGDLLVQNSFSIPIYCKKGGGRTMKTMIYIDRHIYIYAHVHICAFIFKRKQCKDKAKINKELLFGGKGTGWRR